MTHVVTEACIRCKYTDCVDVCPVDCFREGPNFLAIDPDECIDCAVCIPECPVNAILPEEDVPGQPARVHQDQRRPGQELAQHHQAQARAARCRRVEGQEDKLDRADPLIAPTAVKPRPQPSAAAAAHDHDRCADHRRRPRGPVPGLRAGAARDLRARRRRPALRGRPVRRAVRRQADLRHPRAARVHRPRAHRPPAAAGAAVRPGFHLDQLVSHVARRGDGRFDVRTRAGLPFDCGAIVLAAGVGAFVPRTLKVRRPRRLRGPPAVPSRRARAGTRSPASTCWSSGATEQALAFAMRLAEAVAARAADAPARVADPSARRLRCRRRHRRRLPRRLRRRRAALHRRPAHRPGGSRTTASRR